MTMPLYLALIAASGMLMAAVFLSFFRLLRGPSLPDCVVALDLMTTLALGIIALLTIYSGKSVFLDVAIVLALISFLGTVAFARYIEQRERRRGQER